jgi:hypothetical protein
MRFKRSWIPALLLFTTAIVELTFGLGLEESDKYRNKGFIHVQFLSPEGEYLTDISSEEIRLSVSGEPVEIVEIMGPEEPFHIGLVMDVSPSTEEDINPIRQATSDFVSLFPLEDPIMVLTFDSDVFVDCDWTTDRKKVDEAIWEYGLHKSGSTTILREAIVASLEQKFAEKKPRTAMILFSDGHDTGTKDISESDSVEYVSNTGIPIFCIMHFSFAHHRRTFMPNEEPGQYPRIGSTIPGTPGSNPAGISLGRNSERDYIESAIQRIYNNSAAYLRRVTEAADGKFKILGGLDEMPRAYSEIAAELSSVYTIIYQPPANLKGDTARVLIETNRDDTYVRSRPVKVRRID